eukprot:8912255-Alexandrium_andersonii.AAC.1
MGRSPSSRSRWTASPGAPGPGPMPRTVRSAVMRASPSLGSLPPRARLPRKTPTRSQRSAGRASG